MSFRLKPREAAERLDDLRQSLSNLSDFLEDVPEFAPARRRLQEAFPHVDAAISMLRSLKEKK